jgi:hypothetical protein
MRIVLLVRTILALTVLGAPRPGQARTGDEDRPPTSLTGLLADVADAPPACEKVGAGFPWCLPEFQPERFLENLSVFGGLDGSKGPEDLGITADFGIRTGVNWGYPLWEELGLGIQAGTALNYSLSATKVLESIDGTHDRTQSFTTLGLFQRSQCGVNWGVVYDFLYEDYYQNLFLGQWRGQISYAPNDANEVGVWAALADHGDGASVAGVPFSLKPITQVNLFYRHTWTLGAETGFWVGWADEHSKFVYVLPGMKPVFNAVVFGADLQVPLNRWLAIYGEANFVTPNDTGTVTAILGFAFYPGGQAAAATRSRFSPLLSLGGNTNFEVDARR